MDRKRAGAVVMEFDVSMRCHDKMLHVVVRADVL